MGRHAAAWLLLTGALLAAGVAGDTGAVSKPGAAGHALQFRDHDFPSTAMTFEAWVSTSDFCHAGTVMSYSRDSKSNDPDVRIADFNHFVIFDPRNLLACHDYKYIDLKPDPRNESCHSSYQNVSGHEGTARLRLSDCFGGCTDSTQGFYGVMDEVRLWRVKRSQADILRSMRLASGLEGHQDLVAYWKFNDPDGDEGAFRTHMVVRTPEQIKAGMAADEGAGGVDRDDPNLVAYWKFDEGAGYTVKDVTNHGHDLIAAEQPRWEVVRWLSNCGNGMVEGSEECDDGDRLDGDGCSATCRVEQGWTCSGSPSACQRADGAGGASGGGGWSPPPPAPPSGGRAPASGGAGGGGGRAGAVAAGILVPAFAFLFAGLVYGNRDAIFEQFPQARAAAEAARAAASRYIPGLKPAGGRYAALSLDPEELDVSPEFLAPTPLRPPGAPGAYQPLSDA
ncbi:hypothetical protein Rsub_07525 [Raphidocelis subcapitata]|uniref:Uncharacterized protein n=1 Tax=Raphidocelis subcapitata TaxID=307507 RepID=A0A2V0P574_9CHLO|nr:hypothetical protein Rsub_07525 [Raphidocelis subcapitata]|eukprot:GBF95024.1 hypothetical protein Rsub_07525 [Raphidocelis subcapitata]